MKQKYIGGCAGAREYFGNHLWIKVNNSILIPGKEYEILSTWCMENEDYIYRVVAGEDGKEIAVAAEYFEYIEEKNCDTCAIHKGHSFYESCTYCNNPFSFSYSNWTPKN